MFERASLREVAAGRTSNRTARPGSGVDRQRREAATRGTAQPSQDKLGASRYSRQCRAARVGRPTPRIRRSPLTKPASTLGSDCNSRYTAGAARRGTMKSKTVLLSFFLGMTAPVRLEGSTGRRLFHRCDPPDPAQVNNAVKNEKQVQRLF